MFPGAPGGVVCYPTYNVPLGRFVMMYTHPGIQKSPCGDARTATPAVDGRHEATAVRLSEFGCLGRPRDNSRPPYPGLSRSSTPSRWSAYPLEDVGAHGSSPWAEGPRNKS